MKDRPRRTELNQHSGSPSRHPHPRKEEIEEPLWSPVVATGGDQWQIGRCQKHENKPKLLPSAATSCVRRSMVMRGSPPLTSSVANHASRASPSRKQTPARFA